MGLEQLEFAAGQVAVMQQQLIDLQPQLVDTSDRTEKLMIKIEQDTVVVEKQKEVYLFILFVIFVARFFNLILMNLVPSKAKVNRFYINEYFY